MLKVISAIRRPKKGETPAVDTLPEASGGQPVARPAGLGRGVKIILVVQAVVVIVAVVAGSVYFWHPWQSSQNANAALIAAVGRHVILPTDEKPGIGTITDPSKISSTSFLKQGQKGDRILIYAKKGWIILYRPSADRIVDIGKADVAPVGNSGDYQPLQGGQ